MPDTTGDLELDKEIEDTKKELGIDEPKTEEPPKEPKEEPKEEPKKAEEPPKEDQKPEQKPDKPEPKPEPKPELWRQRVAEKHEEKRIKELAEKRVQEILAEKQKGNPSPETGKTLEDIETLAEELTKGLPENEREAQKATIRTLGNTLVQTALKQFKLPAEVEDVLKKSREAEAEQQFSEEFDREVRPLVEQEYGQVSDTLLRTIKSSIKDKIVGDARLLRAPLSLIYNGDSGFRNLTQVEKKSAEPSRPSGTRARNVVDFDNMTEEQFAQLSDEDQDKYADYMREKERKQK